MAIKGTIQPDELSVNRFKLSCAPGVLTNVSEIAAELEFVTLPDGTIRSGGRQKPGTFTVRVPGHHQDTCAALEGKLKMAGDPPSPGYKSNETLTFLTKSESGRKNWILKGFCVLGFKTPAGELKDEGNLAEVEFTCGFDSCDPV